MCLTKITGLLSIWLISITTLSAQNASIRGIVTDDSVAIGFAKIEILGTNHKTSSNKEGRFTLESIKPGDYSLKVSSSFYQPKELNINLTANKELYLEVELELESKSLNDVVISSNIKPTTKLNSPIPIEVYHSNFFKSNPTPSIFEALSNINGVRPQVNCALCNTGDIHINGLEGAYTMMLIDGMPIVSGLATVYGLSGIPQSLVERVEIVKGPASTLYGSEAVGGLVNVITKSPDNAPLLSGEVFTSSWGEVNTDIASKFKISPKVESLLGLNYFNFNQRIDHNNDNFTDVALQNRLSVFNKWNIKRNKSKVFTLAGRYVYEDRFGGDLAWQPIHRGTDSVYGESIYTSRFELLGTYQLPTKEPIMLMFSVNDHNQNSVYGDMLYLGKQTIGFSQLTWDKQLGKKHNLLVGSALRYTFYDDNTPATSTSDTLNPMNAPTETYLPGIFVQDEIKFNTQNTLLLGMRYDYNSIHGNIYTPRINYKWNSKDQSDILRISLGTGYRVANVFTEDHAALTGARDVVFLNDLNPETSYNGNINYVKNLYLGRNLFLGLDGSVFYTYFNNKIFADYETDPSKIIYDNIDGYAVSNGVSLNLDLTYRDLRLMGGATIMDVYSVENNIRERQLLTERFTATWTLNYQLRPWGVSIDYTGNLYSPMQLPTQTTEEFIDPRPAESPWWSIQNIQITKKVNQLEIFGGVKNLLNFTPWRNLGAPLLGNTSDPFGINTSPNNLVFDPSYVYGNNQGIRGFLGIRYAID